METRLQNTAFFEFERHIMFALVIRPVSFGVIRLSFKLARYSNPERYRFPSRGRMAFMLEAHREIIFSKNAGYRSLIPRSKKTPPGVYSRNAFCPRVKVSFCLCCAYRGARKRERRYESMCYPALRASQAYYDDKLIVVIFSVRCMVNETLGFRAAGTDNSCI
jgi:hypothetical protein